MNVGGGHWGHPNGYFAPFVMTNLYKDHLVSVALIALSLFAASYLIAEIGVF